MDKLAELSARQFVRSNLAEILLKFVGTKQDPQVAIDLINKRIIEDFIVIAKDETSKMLKEISEKL